MEVTVIISQVNHFHGQQQEVNVKELEPIWSLSKATLNLLLSYQKYQNPIGLE